MSTAAQMLRPRRDTTYRDTCWINELEQVVDYIDETPLGARHATRATARSSLPESDTADAHAAATRDSLLTLRRPPQGAGALDTDAGLEISVRVRT